MKLLEKLGGLFKSKSAIYEEALSRQEFFLMVSEHILEQSITAHPTPDHHEELMSTLVDLHRELHEEVRTSMNYDEYKRQFRLQDLKGNQND